MNRFLLALQLLASANASALSGLVQTSDGKKHEGSIRLEKGAFIVSETNATNRVELKDLALLQIRPLAPPDSPSPATNAAVARGTNGLLGLYCNALDLTGPFRARLDPTIEFDWGQGPPVAGINPGRFSVRWEGKVVPSVSEHFTFHTITGGGVRLWVNNRLLLDAWRDELSNLASVPMVLMAGERYDLRLEIYSVSGRALAKLYWSSPSMPRSIVPATQLLPAPIPADASLNPVEEKVPAGVMMVGGSIIARRVHSADSTSVRFSDSGVEPVLSTVNVARIFFRALTKESVAALPKGRPGLLLKNQDFIEGDFRGLAQGKIKLSSVLFGNKSYEAAQAQALVLRDLKPAPARFELTTRDDSLFLVNALRIEMDEIALQDAALAGFKVAGSDLVQLKSSRGPRSTP